MSVEKNRENARRAVEEGFADPSNAADLFAPEYQYHTNQMDFQGPQGFATYAKSYRTAFPDMKIKITHLFAEGDMVATFVNWTGTFTGELMGTQPTGRKFDMDACILTRHREDGKQVEAIPFVDTANLYQQLGVPVPA